MLAYLVQSSAKSRRSRICPGRLSIAWLISLVVFSCHYHLQVVTCKVHRSSLKRDQFIFFTLLITCITVVCFLTHMNIGLSIYDVEHTSFHLGLCGCKFILCLFGQCPGLCTICHSWQHKGVVHQSLQADGEVAFEDIPVFGVCRPACHDSSLYLFVLVLSLEAVLLPQVYM